MRDHNGDTVSPRDVLNAEELVAYYANRDRGPRRSQHVPTTRWIRDEVGYVSEDGGRSWRWEPTDE